MGHRLKRAPVILTITAQDVLILHFPYGYTMKHVLLLIWPETVGLDCLGGLQQRYS